MEWIVLGSGTFLPQADRGAAAHLLVGDGVAALFDSGSGAKERLARAQVSPQQLTHLIYSHSHLDHWADLLSLLFLRAYTPASQRRAAQTIIGPAGFPDMVRRAAREVSSKLVDNNADLVWIEAEPGVAIDAGWFELTARTVSHGGHRAVGYRVEGEIQGQRWSVAYSGDSGPCDGLRVLAKDAQCFVCECSLPESKKLDLHMTPEGVRALADEARPGLLVLTHLYPEVLEPGVIQGAFEGYQGKMVVGRDGLRVGLTPGASAGSVLSHPG